jgi:uncharacterized membrane protein
MDLILTLSRSMHVLCLTVWLGGVIFQDRITERAGRAENADVRRAMRMAGRSFTGLLWTGLTMAMVLGVIMFVVSEHVTHAAHGSRRWALFTVKQLILILVAAFVYTRMFRYLDTPSSNGGHDERAETYRLRVKGLRTDMFVLGIGETFISEAMVHSG